VNRRAAVFINAGPWVSFVLLSRHVCSRGARKGVSIPPRVERGPSNSLYLSFLGEWSRVPFTARIERAQFHRARSASKKGTWPLPSLLVDFFSILLLRHFLDLNGCLLG
jgi:hypothetical protein